MEVDDVNTCKLVAQCFISCVGRWSTNLPDGTRFQKVVSRVLFFVTSNSILS